MYGERAQRGGQVERHDWAEIVDRERGEGGEEREGVYALCVCEAVEVQVGERGHGREGEVVEVAGAEREGREAGESAEQLGELERESEREMEKER